MSERITPDPTGLTAWRKSSYSNSDGGSCVEVLDNHPTGVPVRDSKNPGGPALMFHSAAWSAFIADLKHSGR
ncbi:DUF397 domain-containing protein [Streptomyces sp. NPDC096176]|uniref:DUF397 domain-containing protein n=1 Tax=Streptomyces sp. NPDC096176 TaxID=3366079 RepID=UPI0037F75EC2